MLYLSRTSIEALQRCPRKYYLGQKALGTGITKTPKPLALERGIAYHAGVASILVTKNIEDGIAAAFATLKIQRDEFTALETAWWLELTLRAFFRYLESFLVSYEVLTVEREILQPWGKRVTYMSKADAYLRDKHTQGLVVLSNKTASEVNWKTRRDYANDLQGYLEMKYLELYAQAQGWPGEVEYQQTVYAVKGVTTTGRYEHGIIKEVDSADYQAGDIRFVNSPLLYPWVRIDTEEAQMAFPNVPLSWRYRFQKPGNKSENTLAKHFVRRPIWTICDSPDIWFDMLAGNEVFPPPEMAGGKHPLDTVIQYDVPCYRNKTLMTKLFGQLQHQSAELVKKLESIRRAKTVEEFSRLLDLHFPQYLHSCFAYDSQCEFFEFCAGERSTTGELTDCLFTIKQVPEGYERREPHYAAELVTK